jgi:hypothetical protein
MSMMTALKEHFRPVPSVRYDATLRYSECVYCVAHRSSISADSAAAIVSASISNTADGRSKAKKAGLLIHRVRELTRHLKDCPHCSDSVKLWVRTATTERMVAHKLGAASSDAGNLSLESLRTAEYRDRITNCSARLRKRPRLAQSSVTDFARGGLLFVYDKEKHSRLIAEAASVYGVSFSYLSSPLFRQIKALYVGDNDVVVRSGLLINPKYQSLK